MAEILINMDLDGFNNNFFEMQEALVKLQKMLYWLLGHLDSMNVKSLSTNETTIKSTDGTTHLDGSQIKMKDGSKTDRLVMGYNPETGKYEFKMYNDSGVATITLDDNGNAVFSGKITASEIEGGTITGAEITGGSIKSNTTIDVETDLKVGENIYLTSEDDSQVGTVKKIQMFDDEYDNLRVRIEAERMSSNEVELKIVAGKAIISTLDGLFNGAGERFALEKAGVNGSFTTVDGKTINVVNGIIQSIT